MDTRLLIFALLILLPVAQGCGKGTGANPEAERDRQFERMLSGATLIGYSTRDGREGLSKEERYHVDKVARLAGDTWLFQTRLKYGSREIPAPIPITIKWAGDTPVITLTDMSIPGLGTYTARVMLFRDRYAGTWKGKSAGGELFGRIVRASKTP